VGLLGIPLGFAVEKMQIAVLVGLAFAIAASTFFPVLVMGIWWPRMTKRGAIAGLATGILGSFIMILGKSWMPEMLQFENPGGFVMLLSFAAIYGFSRMELAQKGEAAIPHDVNQVMTVLHGPER
jgi:cation/acetate symporter